MEAQNIKIPIVAVVDTNGDPENIDFPVPGNDDAVRAIELFSSKIAEAITEGKKRKMEKELELAKKLEEEQTDEETDKAEIKTEEEPKAAKEIPPPSQKTKNVELKKTKPSMPDKAPLEKPETQVAETEPKKIEKPSEKTEKPE